MAMFLGRGTSFGGRAEGALQEPLLEACAFLLSQGTWSCHPVRRLLAMVALEPGQEPAECASPPMAVLGPARPGADRFQ